MRATLYRVYTPGVNARWIFSFFILSSPLSGASFSLDVKTTPKLDDGQKRPVQYAKSLSFSFISPLATFLSRPSSSHLVVSNGNRLRSLFVAVLSIYPAISWPSFALAFILFADFRRRDQPTVDKLLFTPPNMTFLWRGYRLLLTIFSWHSSPRRTQRDRALARFDE